MDGIPADESGCLNPGIVAFLASRLKRAGRYLLLVFRKQFQEQRRLPATVDHKQIRLAPSLESKLLRNLFRSILRKATAFNIRSSIID